MELQPLTLNTNLSLIQKRQLILREASLILNKWIVIRRKLYLIKIKEYEMRKQDDVYRYLEMICDIEGRHDVQKHHIVDNRAKNVTEEEGGLKAQKRNLVARLRELYQLKEKIDAQGVVFEKTEYLQDDDLSDIEDLEDLEDLEEQPEDAIDEELDNETIRGAKGAIRGARGARQGAAIRGAAIRGARGTKSI
ncbi:unnamed protein product [Sphagnum jensenii]|uniref:Uncharacterized protein n=1 Tax=Sphagnum jensenii TaxID=128206 RepID=A0ABP0VCS2_9BRYO